MAYTETSIRNFLTKNMIAPKNIRYILRENGETCFYMLDNRVISCRIPMSHFLDFFPEEDFTRINKSVTVCNRQVVNVVKGQYLMTDGKSLEGRHHSSQGHSDFMRDVVMEAAASNVGCEDKLLKNSMSILDTMPVPYCMIQLKFDDQGKNSDFIFRYCNQMLSRMDGRPLEKFYNHPFSDVFGNYPAKEWRTELTCISQEGGTKVFHGYNKRYDGFLYMVCYRLAPGYCGCIFFPEGWVNLLENTNIQK